MLYTVLLDNKSYLDPMFNSDQLDRLLGALNGETIANRIELNNTPRSFADVFSEPLQIDFQFLRKQRFASRPILSRIPESESSRSSCATHSSFVRANRAVVSPPKSSLVAASGVATDGIPLARYWSPLIGLLAAAKGLSGSGSNPISKVLTTCASSP